MPRLGLLGRTWADDITLLTLCFVKWSCNHDFQSHKQVAALAFLSVSLSAK